tara:strand:- start:1739 stop:2857 length:1119 start_codon:yes stop_codon:yes gene_type:complete
MLIRASILSLPALFLAGCATTQVSPSSPLVTDNPRTLDMFVSPGNEQCYDRGSQPYTSVVDSHSHFRPFGGNAIPMHDLNDYFRRLGVLFVNVYGIGQTLPIDSGCEYYLDCPDIKVVPSIRNDFHNASNYLEHTPDDIHLTLSMSFPDLAEPAEVAPQIALLDREFPKLFTWMGEVNLVKQALFENGHSATSIDSIADWNEFMKTLEDRDVPIAIHADLGNDDNPTQYRELIEEVLRLYPRNKIVWVHMGLSAQLTSYSAEQHIAIVKSLLDDNPNLMIDISWRVIYDNYFRELESRDLYVNFLNEYSDRVLPGTDFVALHTKDFQMYRKELEVTSRINLWLDDEAFRNIALGENYFRLLKLDYSAPQICQ